ncbi:hypothetical protein Pint_26806 [Pistacia integerrima]|uniref:Uncharacterized protein n=1 Tax=Pistacia integerrima TaxID=434235 RepID=A0ACC0YRJ1_9ROSI|nr:hypothetical protein Pint_26806 [Pistacia integerrima]
MAPKYRKHGQFSIISNVFSFGVLFLEIIGGKKNSYNEEQAQDLLSYFCRHGEIGMKGSFESDRSHLRVGSSSEMISCIHIGLFCVQENVANRPTMASIVLMLTSCYLCLLVPSKSKFFMQSNSEMDVSESPMLDRKENHVQFSLNEASMKIRTSTRKTDCT